VYRRLGEFLYGFNENQKGILVFLKVGRWSFNYFRWCMVRVFGILGDREFWYFYGVWCGRRLIFLWIIFYLSFKDKDLEQVFKVY